MQKLYFDYSMQIIYSEPAVSCHYTIKCIPPTTKRQRVEWTEPEIEPETERTLGKDSFGNQFYYGSVDCPHEKFSFRNKGVVRTGLADYEEVKSSEEAMLYRYPSALTKPGEGLRAYYQSFAFEEKSSDYDSSDYNRAVLIMNRLSSDFSYEKNVTGVATTAEEAWRLGRGVCQDYAHILTALCRLAGIPSRYAAGMTAGEGYSHAWVEILTAGKWYALDPTNNLIVGEEHIKLGNGRDARDCMINRGIIKGGGIQTQNIAVRVSPEMVE